MRILHFKLRSLTAVLLALSLASHAVFPSVVYASDDLCQKILTTQKRIERNGFNIERALNHYEFQLGREFITTLRGLNSNGVWIDSGAGDANAMREYHHQVRDESRRATTIAVGYHAPRPYQYFIETYSDFLKKVPVAKFKYLSDRYFEEIPLEEFPKADLITDLYGTASYTPALDEVIRRYLSILKTDGKIFMWLLDDRVLNSFKEKSILMQYFQSIEGVEVTNPETNQWMIHKVSDQTRVPDLKLIDINDDSPPHRTYEFAPEIRKQKTRRELKILNYLK